LVRSILATELDALIGERAGADRDRAVAAARIFEDTALGEDLPAFFTTDAYARHLARDAGSAAADTGRGAQPAAWRRAMSGQCEKPPPGVGVPVGHAGRSPAARVFATARVSAASRVRCRERHPGQG